ncbi:MAG: hypothetical protein Q9217_000210 [Psora testacea]
MGEMLEILCDIIKAIDPKRLSPRDERSRTLRALRALGEVKRAKFRASLVPLLAESNEEPANFFESWSLQPEDVELGPSSVEPEPGDDESESGDLESEAESNGSESESGGSEPRNIEPGPKRFSLAAEFYKKVSQTRELGNSILSSVQN